MKTTLLLLFACVTMSAQITTMGTELKEPTLVSNGKNLGLEVSYLNTEEGKYYTFMYQNRERVAFIDFRSISFFASDSELETFYADVKGLLETEKEKAYTLNEANVIVKPIGKYLYFFVSKPGETDSMFFITEKNLKKAFGKA